MPRSYRYIHLDVFTDRLFGGNQLAVFLDGRGLSVATIQAIAREMNCSETTFVLPPETLDSDARVRIFTPAEALPVAGHPTVGTTYALARATRSSGELHASTRCRSSSSRPSRHTTRRRCTVACFAPGFGIVEDPATGSASGPLGCYLVRQKVVPPESAGSMLSLQGVKMGRPSHVHIAIGLQGGEIDSVRVGGESVVAGEGTLYV